MEAFTAGNFRKIPFSLNALGTQIGCGLADSLPMEDLFCRGAPTKPCDFGKLPAEPHYVNFTGIQQE